MLEGGIRAIRFLSLSLVILFSALVLYLYTDAGKERLIGLALSRIHHQDIQIKIDKIESYFPLNLKISEIHLQENQQDFLKISNLSLQVDLRKWWSNDILSVDMNVEELAWLAIPQSPPLFTLPQAVDFDMELSLRIEKISYAALVEADTCFLQGSTVNLSYKRNADELEIKGDSNLHVFGQSMAVKMEAAGSFRDFNLTYAVDGQNFDLDLYGIKKIMTRGTISHLPWKPEGDCQVRAIYAQKPATLSSTFSYGDNHFILDDFSLLAKDIKVEARLDYNLKNDSMSGELNADIYQALDHNLIPFSGKMAIQSKFSFQDKDWRGNLKANGNTLRFMEYSLERLNCDAEIEALLKQSKGRIKASLSNLLTPLGGYASVSFNADLLNNAGDIKLSAQGSQSSAEIQLSMDCSRETQNVKLQTFQFSHLGARIQLQKPTQIMIDRGDLLLQPIHLSIMDSALEISGQMKKGNADFHLKGQLDAYAFSRMLLTDDDVANGKIDVDLKVKGPWSKLRMEGGAEVKNGTYEKIIFGTLVKDIHIKVRAENDSFVVESAKGRDAEEGEITATGRFSLSEARFDVLLKANNLQLLRSDQLTATVRQGQIRLEGIPSQAKISGDLIVDRAFYSIAPQASSPRDSLHILNPVKREKLSLPTDPHKQLSSSGFNPELNINIEIPPTLKISGRGLDSVWKGQLQITGTYDDTVILGALKLDKGSINFLGQDVVMTRGDIRFDGYRESIPLIDAMGILAKPDLEVRILVVGRVNKPTIDLQSQPDMPKDEIISYLFFGKEKASLSPIEGVQLARALITYRGGGKNLDVFGILSENLGLDQISIGEGANDGTYALKLSKRLGDKIRINLNQGISPEESSVELEVDVTKSVSVKAEHGFDGASDGVSVNYNWDY